MLQTLDTSTGPDLAPPTPAAALEVPHVRPGSCWDAKVLRGKIQELLARIDRADEQVRLLCHLAQERAIFKMLEAPDGRYFDSWHAFVTAPVPWGLGVAPDLVAELVKEHRDPKRKARLVLEAPQLLLTRSAPRKGRTAAPARGIDYSLQRLKRDRPDLLERVASGELTIQAAAEEAGHRPPFTGVLVEPMAIARLVVSRLDAPQQRELIDLVQHPERITDPGKGQRSQHWEAYRQRTTPPAVLAQQRARAEAEQAAHREAYTAAYKDRRRELNAARRAQAAALGLPSLAVAEAAG